MHLSLYLLIIIILSSGSVLAADQLLIFRKCMVLFSNEFPAPDNGIYQKVKSGQLSGSEGCMKILEAAQLIPSGDNELKLDSSQAVQYELGKKVLRTFNLAQRSFFDTSFVNNLNERDHKIYDYNDRSYFLLRHLFTSTENESQNYPVSEIFTDSNVYGSIRDASNKNIIINTNSWYHPFHGILSALSDTGTMPIRTGSLLTSVYDEELACQSGDFTKADIDYEKAFVFDDPIEITKIRQCFGSYSKDMISRVEGIDGGRYHIFQTHDAPIETQSVMVQRLVLNEHGNLIGLREKPSFKIDQYYSHTYKKIDGYARSWLGPFFRQTKNVPVEINRTLGAGILFPPSTQSSFMTTLILQQDGLTSVPRLWVPKFLSNFLCRKLPLMRSVDAVQFIDPGSEIGYRKGISCMACHATMDNLSYIARGHRWLQADVAMNQSVHVNMFLEPKYSKTVFPVKTPDPYFVVRPADGHLRLRDMHGNFHNVPLTSTPAEPQKAFSELGQYLAGMDDTYACLASKYFDWFTGHKVELHDPGELNSSALDAAQRQHLAYIKKLGAELKGHQNLKQTFLDIIASPYFIEIEK